MRALRALAGALLGLWCTVACAADGEINTGQSSLIATFLQQNAPIDAVFRRYSGSVTYDPTKPAGTVASLAVDMNSLDVGDEDTNAEVRKSAWFDTAHFPQASFHTTTVRPGATGHLEVSGTLEIKGRTQNVSLVVSVAPLDRGQAYDGKFEISRAAFGIGDPSWNAVLDDKVRIRFHLVVANP